MPGFLTDFIGFMLLIPFTRKILLSFTFKNKLKQEEKKNETIEGEILDKKKMTYKIIGKYIKDLNLIFQIQKHFFFFQKIYLVIK